jgi:hypothetical protein
MWRRRGISGLGGRRTVRTGRGGYGYSFATVLVGVAAVILLILYLTGRISL